MGNGDRDRRGGSGTIGVLLFFHQIAPWPFSKRVWATLLRDLLGVVVAVVDYDGVGGRQANADS